MKQLSIDHNGWPIRVQQWRYVREGHIVIIIPTRPEGEISGVVAGVVVSADSETDIKFREFVKMNPTGRCERVHVWGAGFDQSQYELLAVFVPDSEDGHTDEEACVAVDIAEGMEQQYQRDMETARHKFITSGPAAAAHLKMFF